MGTPETNVIYGYLLYHEDLEHLRKKRERITHFEKRYDPKTGEQLPDVEVVDQKGGSLYYFNGTWFDDELEGWNHDLIDAISEFFKQKFKFGETWRFDLHSSEDRSSPNFMVLGVSVENRSYKQMESVATKLSSLRPYFSEILKTNLRSPKFYSTIIY